MRLQHQGEGGGEGGQRLGHWREQFDKKQRQKKEDFAESGNMED